MKKEYYINLFNNRGNENRCIKTERNKRYQMEVNRMKETRKNKIVDKYSKLSGDFFDKEEIENIMKYNDSSSVILYLLLCMEALKYDGKIELTRNNIMRFYRRNERFMNHLGDRLFITIMSKLIKNNLVKYDKNHIYINNWKALVK